MCWKEDAFSLLSRHRSILTPTAEPLRRSKIEADQIPVSSHMSYGWKGVVRPPACEGIAPLPCAAPPGENGLALPTAPEALLPAPWVPRVMAKTAITTTITITTAAIIGLIVCFTLLTSF